MEKRRVLFIRGQIVVLTALLYGALHGDQKEATG